MVDEQLRRDLDALSRLELREAELLAWGAVGAEWTAKEIQQLLDETEADPDVLARLEEKALVVRTPNQGYRTRSAETVRLMATLRQAFRHERVTEGKPLVLDHRFLHRPRRRPKRDLPADKALAGARQYLDEAGEAVARAIAPPHISGFQQRSAENVLKALCGNGPAGVIVTAGTGSGKTLAFYLPLLAWLADRATKQRAPGTLALALYPRNELLKDQLRALLRHLETAAHAGAGPTLSVATWFGPTPADARSVKFVWQRKGKDYICPYLRCLQCNSDLVWRNSDISARPAREGLECTNDDCGARVDGSVLRLTRDSAQRNPAHVMLTTTESLNRQLSAPGNLVAFGVVPPPGTAGVAPLAAVLLDEVHTYEGPSGAQNAILFRRLKHRLRRDPVWVGLSATLRAPESFLARLVNLAPSTVQAVHPQPSEMEVTGAEYLVALRHNPHSRTGPLSLSIQSAMVLARCLDNPVRDPMNPALSSEGVFGSKVFVFTDKLDSTNRLYWDLCDAEGHGIPSRQPTSLAHLRSAEQSRMKADLREPEDARDETGQRWWLPDILGHELEADRSLMIGRTSSQDRGVATLAQVVVATATLEVGFDDDQVGAVIQHKAPHDAAQFLQRKGRAGRSVQTRPWTVVVLSDWGRDRQAWDAYDAMFDPELPPRTIPVENLYVLRIQAVYALLDWLAMELRYKERESTWTDLSGSAAQLFPNNASAQAATEKRQLRLQAELRQLLESGTKRSMLRRHLQHALGLGHDDLAESIVDTLLWESPRPLLVAVIPTMLRRLEDNWQGEPVGMDNGLQTRTPLRDFVPGNLFDDLLVPDVEFTVPGQRGKNETEHLPALRALREFCPGNVSRHFGVHADNKRHWIPLPTLAPGEPRRRVDVTTAYQARFVDRVDTGDTPVDVYSPVSATLEAVDRDVKDASSMTPDWEFHVSRLGSGNGIRLGRGAERLLAEMTAHLHVQGGGVRAIRFARTAHGTLWNPTAEPVQLEFGIGGAEWVPAAIGVDLHCDALEAVVKVPVEPGEPTPTERTTRLRYAVLVEADLPKTMTVFHRESLVKILVAAVLHSHAGGPGLRESEDWSIALISAAATLGIVGKAQDDATGAATWREWLTDHDVVAAVREAAAEVLAVDRSPEWVAWWRRTYTVTAAHLVLDALAACCPGIDPDEVAIDLDPEHDDRFWLSERSPGGTGQIEAFQRALAQDPNAFSRALEDTMLPSSVEIVDEQLSALLRAPSPEVSASLDALRRAWRNGHEAVSDAVLEVERVARENDIVLDGPARSTLSTRVAGPGAHPDLVSRLKSWLELRDQITDSAQLAVDPQTFGVLVAADKSIDALLHLGAETEEARRARAVSNVLWPWGTAPGSPSSLYGTVPEIAPHLIREHVRLAPDVVELSTWDEQTRVSVHALLVDLGEVVLAVRQSERDLLRSVLLDLQTRPIEVGALLVHPVTVGLRENTHSVEVRVLLREAL
ncbi:protein DpdJ [Crossiella sp. CA-258035]|uniref:protein DpdJ n=1 Tax=Crossiella sp. CA-258035 TaxID=2981138 RepID=UPI0024BC5CF0|nr:protein DpdJ [Crossiella sp. CA-258035]WHT23262.1 protein DpdJ [Crossiella sp. CA-258035]